VRKSKVENRKSKVKGKIQSTQRNEYAELVRRGRAVSPPLEGVKLELIDTIRV